MKTMDQIIREDARLTILKALEQQPDGRLNSELLRQTLEAFGINKTRDWVHEELRWLEDLGAIKQTAAGSVRIAEILAKGRDHVERRIVIEGIKRPSPPEA
jgi:Fe2+ or Zn2+ uptake regulation protein